MTPGAFLTPHLKMRLLVWSARLWVGMTEVGGNNRGQVVERFQRAVDGKASGEPWCAAFALFCVDMVDGLAAIIGGGEPSALYRSEHVQTIWLRSPETLRLPRPQPGCMMLWQHWKGGQPTQAGHIAVVAEVVDEHTVRTLEGNTGAPMGLGQGVEREGDGVYERVRSIRGTGPMRVKGFLRAWS